MSLSLNVDKKSGYLHVRVSGPNTPENVAAYLAAAHDACVAQGCGNLLIEENLQGPGLSVTSIYEVISGASRTVLPVRRIAYVDTNPEHDPDRMRFAETAAVNRLINVRVFPSIVKAERWMQEAVSADADLPDAPSAVAEQDTKREPGVG